MPFHIEIVCLGEDVYGDADAAARLLTTAQGGQPEFVFAIAPPQYRHLLLGYQLDEYSRDQVFAKLAEYRKIAKGDRRYLIAVVAGRLRSATLANLFGSHDAEKGDAVVTIIDFARYLKSRKAFLAFFLLRFGMSFVCPERMGHEDSPTCLFHKRMNKRALIDGAYEGELCDECVKALSDTVNPEIHRAFKAMLAAVKRELPPKDQDHVREKVALVMKGGGVKGLALVGAFIELSKRFEFNAFAGTSAGAIVAALAALGSTPQQLEATLRTTDFRSFEDASWPRRLWNVVRYQYLHPGIAFEKWLWNEIKKVYVTPSSKVLPPTVENAPRHLVIFAAKAGNGLIRFDSEDANSERRLLITFAVRASMSLPGFFKPPLLNGQSVFDGGLLANFPAKEWVGLYPSRPFIGIYLGPQVLDPTVDASVLSDAVEIVTTRDDYPFINDHRDSVVMVDPAPISTADFGLSKQEADFLVLQGRACALEHMTDILGHKDLAGEAASVRKQAEDAKIAAIAVRRARRRRRKAWTAAILALLVAAVGLRWFLAPPTPTPIPQVVELEIAQIKGDDLLVGGSALLTAVVRNRSGDRFLRGVRTIWTVNGKPIQDVPQTLDVSAQQGSSELHALYRFETPGKQIVRLEILLKAGVTSTVLAVRDAVVAVNPESPAAIVPVPKEGADLFEGTWYISFYFLGTPTDPPKPWFSWTGHLAQNGDQVNGQISSGSYVGEVRGLVSADSLSGNVRFPWDGGNWWPEFKLTLSEDRQSAAGSARYEFTDARGTHAYRLEAHRLPN